MHTKDFQKNKLKGDFAELICKHHFELMGCDVQKVGIEELSPAFAKLRSAKKAVASLKKQMQLMPDFLVVHPDGNNASFVEVKYRNNSNKGFLREFSKELHLRYSEFIKDSTPVYFYLVTNQAPFIHIMKANILGCHKETGGFYPAQDSSLDGLPFFRGYKDNSSFNAIYNSIICPTIKELIVK